MAGVPCIIELNVCFKLRLLQTTVLSKLLKMLQLE
jgi:hypothetical protein